MKRVLTAVVLVLAVFALIFLGQLWMLTLAACVVAELAAYEYRALANAGGARIPLWWMAAATALLFYVTYYRPIEAQLPVLSALALVLLAWTGFRGTLERVLPDAALGLFGLVYVAYPLTPAAADLGPRRRQAAAALSDGVRVGGDIAAFYTGRALGRHKLTPLSPNKTWEGSIASVAGSVVGGLAVVYLGEAALRARQYGAAYSAAGVAVGRCWR